MSSRTHLFAGCVLVSDNVSHELDNTKLESEADTKERFVVLAGEADCVNHAFNTAVAESARNEDTVKVAQVVFGVLLGIEPVNIDLGRELAAGVF